MCENLDLGLDTNEPDLPLAGMNRDIYISFEGFEFV